jgi:hypothetical protein
MSLVQPAQSPAVLGSEFAAQSMPSDALVAIRVLAICTKWR